MKEFRDFVKTTYAGLMEVEGLNEASPSKYEKHMNVVNDIKHHLHDFKGVGEEKTNPTEFRGQLPESKKSQLHELLTKTHGYRHSIKYGGDYYRKGASGISVSGDHHPLAKPGHRFVSLSGTEDQPQVRHG